MSVFEISAVVVFLIIGAVFVFFIFSLKQKLGQKEGEITNINTKLSDTEKRLKSSEELRSFLQNTSHDLGKENAVRKNRIQELERGERRLFLFEVICIVPAGIPFYAPAFMNTKTGTLSPVTEEWRIIDREVVFSSMMCEGKTPILHSECCIRGIQHLEDSTIVTLFGEDYRFPSGNPSELQFDELQLVT